MPLTDLAKAAGNKLIQANQRRGYPLRPLTSRIRAPLRWLYHRSPYLQHDSRFHWRPNLLLGLHSLLVGEHPADFTIYQGQLKFRSTGSVMSMQGYYVGEVERHLVDFVTSQVKPDFVMIDVGAHHGVYSMVVAHHLRARGWHGRIHSFEPDPRNFALLEHNLSQNGLREYAVLHQAAVSRAVGEDSLLGEPSDNSGNTLASTGDFAINPQTFGTVARKVAVTTLDSEFSDLQTVHLVKVDVQGAEPLVLEGAAGLIERHGRSGDRGGSRLAVDRAHSQAAHRPRVPRSRGDPGGAVVPPGRRPGLRRLGLGALPG